MTISQLSAVLGGVFVGYFLGFFFSTKIQFKTVISKEVIEKMLEDFDKECPNKIEDTKSKKV